MTWHPLSLYKICEASDKAKRKMPQSYWSVSLCTPDCQWYQQKPLSQEEEKDEMVEKSWLNANFKPGGGNHMKEATAQRILYGGDASE
ncbi:hypothetical protein TYRP_005313 [Tyrophagus putrescentiae]|nr:hypothetical protein TYRP_005313 [Tyrophagus putrescentiae]